MDQEQATPSMIDTATGNDDGEGHDHADRQTRASYSMSESKTPGKPTSKYSSAYRSLLTGGVCDLWVLGYRSWPSCANASIHKTHNL
jgi:hypothetical protein